MNQFGRYFRITCFGASHGPCIGVVMDAPKAGIPLSPEDFEAALARRRGGRLGTTPRVEADVPVFLSGVANGYTTGAPLTVIFENRNQRSRDYDGLKQVPRPGHADWVAGVRYQGYQETAGGGVFSGRMTLALVAAGVVAQKMLPASLSIGAKVVELGGLPVQDESAPAVETLLETCRCEGDSLGAVVECSCEGVPVGLGEPFFDSVESLLAHGIFSIPGVRGIEFGDGFQAARMRGSEHNDPYTGPGGRTAKNGAGGINGGLTNGNPVVFRVAFKPTSSIAKEQKTWDEASQAVVGLAIQGRHDVCFALRTPVVVESVASLVLLDCLLAGSDAHVVR